VEEKKKIEILECTLRDGSYSVDFKFTLQDTALLAKLLCDVGFKYIEVAHGVGLGAARAGKGQTPWSDEEAIRVAKSAVGDKAELGVFCIPGIANFDDMKRAVDAGLNFVRIGQNAPVSETTFPYIKEALKLGITPCVNFMKSYGVPPEEFGQRAKAVAEAGARMLYVVDSAGGMMPEQIARYFDEAHKNAEVPLGFHGHNNLYLVIANCLEAIKHGATFIDGTLFGLGRSAGNAPTEILVAVLQNLGYDVGPVDLFRVMDIAEAYMAPLISQVQMYDMMSVTAGYSLFHSSYLPKVAKMAEKYEIELRRLVAAMGKKDPVNCPDDVLENLAKDLAKNKTKLEARQEFLISFNEPGFESQRISNTVQSAHILIEGLLATAAKRNARPVLDLVASSEPTDDLIVSEFVQTDNSIVLGRILFGSWQVLEEAIGIAVGKVSGFLVNEDGGSWADVGTVVQKLKKICPEDSIFVYSSKVLQLHHLLDHLTSASGKKEGSILISGMTDDLLPIISYLEKVYQSVYLFKPAGAGLFSPERIESEDKVILLRDYSDWKHLRIKTMVVYFHSMPDVEDAEQISRIVEEDGTVLFRTPTTQEVLRIFKRRPDLSVVNIDKNDAYKGQFPRWMNINSLIRERYRPLDS